MELRKFLLIITATLIVALILAVWFYPSNDDFRVDNPFWNGIKDVQADYRGEPINSLSDLPSPPNGATLLIIPYISYTSIELEQLNHFVLGGGRLIIADDYGHGNQILEYLGPESRFSRQILLDPLVNYKNKYFPRIIHLQSDPLTSNTDNIVFNHATSLINVPPDTILAVSSPFSFLDYNADGTRQNDEPTGPLAVISRHELGSGQVILIADPSLFINGMNKIEGNNVFMQNIAATASALYIDQSHLTFSELHHTKIWLQQARGLLSTPIGTAGLVIAAIIIALTPIWYEKRRTTVET